MPLSVVPYLTHLAAGNAIVKSCGKLGFPFMCICVMVDIILMYCFCWVFFGRIINVAVDLNSFFLFQLSKTLLLIGFTNLFSTVKLFYITKGI